MKNSVRILLSTAVALVCIGGPAVADPMRGGVVDVATIGEPPTLDPVSSTADLVGIISQHMFETLYTFDKNWAVTPLLAAAMPKVSADGTVYTIELRPGVTFHDGTAMTSKDVVASLQRWLKIGSRGKQVAANVVSIEPAGDLAVKITLKSAYAPLTAFLAFNNSAAIVIPAANNEDTLTKFVGTGPYMLKERKPDQYVQLVRFPGYASRAGDPDGYGGARKQYLDEIRFVPVPDANTRVEGAVAGQFGYVDSLPIESFARVKAGKDVPMMLKPFGWPMFVMNTKQGVLADLGLRKAIQAALAPEDMLTAAFGSKEFFAVEGSMYPKDYVWATDAGTDAYKPQGDTAAASALLKKANYDPSKPIRILTSRQYEFHYKMALVAQEYLKAAGFAVQLDVVEWATLIQRRADPALWDIYITHSPFLPEPALIGFMSDAAPGWWTSPAKTAAIGAFNTETDPAKRLKLWAEVQKVIYAEAPAFKVGNFNALAAKSPKLEGVAAAPWPYFWNAWLEK
ncbi:ABC transporter substrate-binding protein [Siculibacillus lacustris]|uniref:ABC transporter substrate-binding protein n=1 Tax=Siculibacillus lacustris TaxID=1549641 RepID=A0A4Q9VXT2_9HYPH|nr:ABC transporter substrate-binding protein [Siculibacillus lacustris]TBW41316.1 ABC transporter substrate-binding protein [Siculibacillus lacustris]